MLPKDILLEITRLFPEPAVASVIELLESLPFEDRIRRCALQHSRGELARLEYARDIALFDPRDVIVFGEYVVCEGVLLKIRDLEKAFIEIPARWQAIPHGAQADQILHDIKAKLSPMNELRNNKFCVLYRSEIGEAVVLVNSARVFFLVQDQAEEPPNSSFPSVTTADDLHDLLLTA